MINPVKGTPAIQTASATCLPAMGSTGVNDRLSRALSESLLLILLTTAAGCTARDEHPGVSASFARNPDFTEVSIEAGLGGFRHERGAAGDFLFPEINGSGAAFIDYDRDGWPDILLAGGGVWTGSGLPGVPAVWLYRNERDGTFSLQTEAAGLAGFHDYAYGFAVADYDNDGDDDFYLTTVTRNRLFRNEGGRFSDVTDRSGAGGATSWSNSAAFFDADRDGALDLYVTNYVAWTPSLDMPCYFGLEKKEDYCTPLMYAGEPSTFFHNRGDHTFEDRTDAAGFLPSPGKSMGVALLDHNHDGWIDVAVSNDGEPDHLFENNGDGTFRDVGFVTGMALNSRGQPQAGMGIDAGDIDGSGEDAIVVGNFANETMGLFQHDRSGLFVDRTRSSNIAMASMRTLTFGLMLFDADLDGDLDIFSANGHISLFADEDSDPITVRQAPHLFVNAGDGTFRDAAPEIQALSAPVLGRGAAYADYDLDGDLDVLLTQNGGAARLYRNEIRASGETDGPSYVRIRLEGTPSNRSAIGAEVRLYAGGKMQRRRVRSGSSYLSQSELPLTFGLGNATAADSLVIYWPSGRRHVLRDVPVNRAAVFHESDGRLTDATP